MRLRARDRAILYGAGVLIFGAVWIEALVERWWHVGGWLWIAGVLAGLAFGGHLVLLWSLVQSARRVHRAGLTVAQAETLIDRYHPNGPGVIRRSPDPEIDSLLDAGQALMPYDIDSVASFGRGMEGMREQSLPPGFIESGGEHIDSPLCMCARCRRDIYDSMQ